MATDTTGKVTITINLDDADINGTVKKSALIQQQCYKKLETQIVSDLGKEIQRDEAENYPMGSGLVYFIDGTRGAGKSTFLKAVYSSLASSETDIKDIDGKPARLGELAYIDPSRVEDSEIILLPILKELKRRVEAAQARCILKGEDSNSKFRKQFKKIAGGLSLFSPGNDQLKDIDAELFLDWGVERAEHSIGLRKNLHDLIHTACGILKVKAVILAFDDADTNAVSAMKVLECIRKYLDTPELVVLVTGDMELYSQQVRDYFYDSMGKHLSGMDGERRAQRTKMVDHLEDQYLLKLFPIRRRIQLGPIWNLIDAPDSAVSQPMRLTCGAWGNDQGRTVNSVVNELIRRGLRLKSLRDIELYREYLLKQPIRSILQVLSCCAAHLSHTDAIGESSIEWNKKLSDALSEGLRAMALGSLYKFGVDVDAIGALEMPALVDAVFELTVRDGELDTGAYLRPQSSDSALKSSFAALSADISRFCASSPESLLHYLVTGPGSVAVYGQVMRRKRKEIEGGKTTTEKLQADFKKYMGIGRKEDTLNWAWHTTSILTVPYVAGPTRAVVYFGVIGLNKSKPDNATGISARTAIKRCEAAGAIPVFAFSLIDVSGQGVGTFASIFNTLGLLDRLLRLDRRKIDKLKSEVNSTLAKVYKTPTISRPGWEGEGATSDESGSSEDDGDTETSNANLNLITDQIVDWLTKSASLRQKIRPSAVLIGKIWTRIYFSLEKVSEYQRGKVKPASLMERFALCVINAFLVEELEHHLLDDSVDRSVISERIDRSNPLGAPSIVAGKFSNSLVTADRLPLTFLIASCPLILGLLLQGRSKVKGRNSNEIDVYQPMLDRLKPYGATTNNFCNEETWEAIESSWIAGWSWPDKPAENSGKVKRTYVKKSQRDTSTSKNDAVVPE